MKVPSFETERLSLREVNITDIPSYNKYFSNYEIIRHLSAHFPWPYPEQETLRFLQDHYFPEAGKSKWLWGIFRKEMPETLIGCVYLWRKANPENRGFWLGQEFWGQGFMTEALVPVTNLAFASLGFEKLILANAVGNESSRKLKLKAGAKLVRTQPFQFVDPSLSALEIWELTKDEWELNSTIK